MYVSNYDTRINLGISLDWSSEKKNDKMKYFLTAFTRTPLEARIYEKEL